MKYQKCFAGCASLILGLSAAVAGVSPGVAAASAQDFDAGNIMSDAVMRNYGSMDIGAIQSFLKSKNACNDTRTYMASWWPSVSYHVENGHFVCMADESFNGKSAAQIIYEAAQDYKINPQVLIVTLQKEQGLVTDTYPHNLQYRTAMGYGCPDAAQCEAKYYGFENQVRNAAALYNTVLSGGWTNYPMGTRYIAYSPRSGCGGTNVNIQNLATSALYRYTPYQPNAAAKSAGYGMGDGCSTYGNRNFYLYFSDWFGSTQTVADATTASAKTSNVYTGSPIGAGALYIPDGNYRISTTTGRALDIVSGGTASGTNVQIYNKNDSAAQVWRITRESDGYYRISNPQSGKSLDVSGASRENGANIQIWDSNNSCAQKWVASMQDGYFVFRNACSGNAIDVSGGHISTAQTNVNAWQYNQTKAQLWKLTTLDEAPVKGGTYSFLTANGKTALDVAAAGTSNGTNVQIYAANGTAAQKFKLARGTDGYYRITNPNAEKSLDVASAGTHDGANVQLWDNNDTCAQKWAVGAQDGKYVFRNACSGKVLDVSGGAIGTNSTNVQIYTYNRTAAQLWDLKK